MLQLIDIHFDYQDQPLLKGVNFQLNPGDLLHIQGTNGVGKTTLFKIISGLHLPTQGRILYNGVSIRDNLVAYHQNICFVGHKTGINPCLTLRENCFFDLHANQLTNQELMCLASIFNLEHHIDFPCSLLSAGQKRQVGLLRLWFSDVSLWLLDEPFTALDNRASSIMIQRIEEHRSKGGAVILTSHQRLTIDSTSYQEYCL